MRIVFMGTPRFAQIVLERLMEAHEICAVYTRPDAVRGRGRALLASPVKELAEKRGLTVCTPRSLRDADEQAFLASIAPDAICVAAYGLMLPAEVLAIPRYACLNVHASLLPRWRGAAPVERAILAGDEQAGVAIMQMEQALDTGPYCMAKATPIGTKSSDALSDELAALGADALIEALCASEQGGDVWVAQDESLATYAEKLDKCELALDPADDACRAQRKVQASSDAHPARAVFAGRTVQVLRAALPEAEDAELVAGLRPGALRFVRGRLFAGCSEGTLELLELKPAGKQAMDARSFAAGIQGIKQQDFEWGAIDAL